MSEEPNLAVAAAAPFEPAPNDLDETYGERLVGLTEMFPDWTKRWAEEATERSAKGVKIVYRCVCLLTWVCFTTSMMLFAPVVFETERDLLERRRSERDLNKIRDQVRREMNWPAAAAATSPKMF